MLTTYRKVCYVCNNKNHFKVCCPREIKKDESDEPSNQSNCEFFMETINVQNSIHINQIKKDWSITVPSNGIRLSCKIYTIDQCNVIPLTIFKKFDPEPNFCAVNICI